MFSNEFLTGGEMKRDAEDSNGTTAVPIPSRRPADLFDLGDLDISQDSTTFTIASLTKLNYDAESSAQRFPMDDDDIFQVDESDLIRGPTLAELNANPDALLDVDLDFDDIFLPVDHTAGPPNALTTAANSSSPSSPYDGYSRSQTAFSPSSQHSSASSSFLQPYAATLHELTVRAEPGRSDGLFGQSVPPQLHLPSFTQQLSSSAPTRSHLTMDQIWQRREPRKHLVSTSSLAELGSVSSLSGGLLSPGGAELSQDEDDQHSDDEDSERYEDFSSDDSDAHEGNDSKQRSLTKKERFFWQYNVQAKGPKGQRLVLKPKLHDPHVLNSVTDPVFSQSCSVRGIKHSGKARKGDGNDLTPNPRKLFLIGKELDGLGRVINDMTPVSELPANVRPKTRKEKNKLASRACRLKKKAQHEANKLKLYGLENEHKRLISGIEQAKRLLANRLTGQQTQSIDWTSHVQSVVNNASEMKIAGRTSEFVNEVLDEVRAGKPNGGLTDI